MKRDLVLIGKIVSLMLQENQFGNNQLVIDRLENENYSKYEIYYHIYLMYKAGFIEGYKNVEEKDGYFYGWRFPAIMPTIITWKGYEWIDEVGKKQLDIEYYTEASSGTSILPESSG